MSTPTTDRDGVQQVIRTLLAADHKLLAVFDGEETISVRNEAEALDAIFAVDSAQLYFALPDKGRGGVLFVLGNGDLVDPVADYTTNLAPILDDLTRSWWS